MAIRKSQIQKIRDAATEHAIANRATANTQAEADANRTSRARLNAVYDKAVQNATPEEFDAAWDDGFRD